MPNQAVTSPPVTNPPITTPPQVVDPPSYNPSRSLITSLIAWIVLAAISYAVYGFGTYIVFKENFDWSSALTGFALLAVIIERFVSIVLNEETTLIDSMRADIRNTRFHLKTHGSEQSMVEPIRLSESLDLKTRRKNELLVVRSSKFLVLSLIAGLLVASLGFRLFEQATSLNSPSDAIALVVAPSDGNDGTPEPVSDGANPISQDSEPDPAVNQNRIELVRFFGDIILTGILLSGGSRFIDGTLQYLKDGPRLM